MYTRYFLVDQSHFKYYENKGDRTLKRALEIKDARAEFQNRSTFEAERKTNKDYQSEDHAWAVTTAPYRVAIFLPERLKGGKPSPVFHYTSDLHEAKFLAVNIQVYGDGFRN